MSPWGPSGIVGHLPGQAPDIKDDFFLGINYDDMELPQGAMSSSATDDLAQQVYMQIFGLAVAQDPTNDAQRIYSSVNKAYTDMGLRNQYGIEDLEPLIDDLMAAEDLDDLTEFITSGEYMLVQPFVSIGLDLGLEDSSEWTTYVGVPALVLSDAAQYGSETIMDALAPYNASYERMFELIGYSPEESEAMTLAAASFEIEMADHCLTAAEKNRDADLYGAMETVALSDMEELSPSFPLADILVSQGYLDDEYVTMESEWLDFMNSAYTQENFEELRAYLLRSTLATASQFLSQPFFEAYASAYGSDLNVIAINFVVGATTSVYNSVIDQMYLAAYAPSETYVQTVEDMFETLKEKFRERLDANTWIGEEARQYAYQKLDAMTILVGGPETPDYSGFVLPSSVGEGGPLADYIAMDQFNRDIDRSMIGQQGRDGYTAGTYSYTVNAFYQPKSNSVFVTAAFLQGGLTGDITVYENLLAGLGFVIGHEITHGFDPNGSMFDKDGNFSDWWSAEDREAFDALSDSYADYFSHFEVFPAGTYTDGHNVLGEAVADLGGMALVLDLAADTEGFDYEKFFTTLASTWRQIMTEQYAEIISSDVHPYNCYRINATVQQFQVFYDTFGITEGDGMWLDPEDRFVIW